jgi:hypothetical protein
MSVDLAKVRPGDLVLVYSPMRGDGSGQGSSANGLYLVLKVGATHAEVIPTSLDQSRTSIVRATEIKGLWRAFAGDIEELPVRPMDLDRPIPVPPPAAPAPEPEPVETIAVIAVNRTWAVAVTRPKTATSPQVTNTYKPGRIVAYDSAGQPHVEFVIDRLDLDLFRHIDQPTFIPGTGDPLEILEPARK